jgi:hypothetical protein
MKRQLLRILHTIGSETSRVVGGALVIVSGIAALVDAYDDKVGFPGLFYIGAILIAAGLILMRPIYQRLFDVVDQEQKIQFERERDPQEDEQRETLRTLQDLLPQFSSAARAIYEERRSQYLQAKTKAQSLNEPRPLSPNLQPYFQIVSELDQTVLNLITRVKDPKIRKAAGIIYELDRRMAFLEPSTWDSRDLYGGYTPSFLMVDRQHQLTRMIGKLLRGESIDDEVVEDVVHKAREHE